MNIFELVGFLSFIETDLNIIWLVLIEFGGFIIVYFKLINKILNVLKLFFMLTQYLILLICLGPVGNYCTGFLCENIKKITCLAKKFLSNITAIFYLIGEVKNLKNIEFEKVKKTKTRKLFKYVGTFSSIREATNHLENELGCEYKYR
jgi:hypothetical protein